MKIRLVASNIFDKLFHCIDRKIPSDPRLQTLALADTALEWERLLAAICESLYAYSKS